jgi:hypothetical protein
MNENDNLSNLCHVYIAIHKVLYRQALSHFTLTSFIKKNYFHITDEWMSLGLDGMAMF